MQLKIKKAGVIMSSSTYQMKRKNREADRCGNRIQPSKSKSKSWTMTNLSGNNKSARNVGEEELMTLYRIESKLLALKTRHQNDRRFQT